MAKAADVVKASTEYYNSRDFDRWLGCYAPDASFVDLAQGVTAKGRDEILAYGQGWVDALSDAAYTDVRITEAGDTVTMQFNGEGVNDGAFGTFAPTGKRVSFPVVNVITVNAKGEISRLEQLYDRMDILIQLGHVPAS
jgi:ketosteroid isomerase-like protein